MAIETFTWPPDDEATSDNTLKVRKSQFGDGYVQTAGDGLNGESDSWSLTFGGVADETQPILAFIRRHKGFKSFLWTTPNGELGLYRCETFGTQRRPGGILAVTATFERAYHP
ncbi:phage tail protein [Pseudomonas sp. GD03858]|uniref:phage tail protein n=1 Tax=unclassified Pseudomonas TaxID=196821 RepID=UPI002449C396|nr:MULTISPECIES: phage tail protein [unclassified Pseudomonas]MDH0646223.1 phage tail protein [Pseudomonas sp. GD03867]MDH0661778.1 phage tail protein [Pseudomonas sp. GD03858]